MDDGFGSVEVADGREGGEDMVEMAEVGGGWVGVEGAGGTVLCTWLRLYERGRSVTCGKVQKGRMQSRCIDEWRRR